jgi:hypothetical protein
MAGFFSTTIFNTHLLIVIATDFRAAQILVVPDKVLWSVKPFGLMESCSVVPIG